MRSTACWSIATLFAVTLCIGHADAAQIAINDAFEVDSSADYIVVGDGTTPNGTQTFAFDYIAASIPLAPRSAPGTRGGLKLTANDSAAVADAWTVFHKKTVGATKYTMEVDVFMKYTGTAGTTEHAHVGVGGNGTTFNSLFTPISGSGAYIAFDGDGGSASDYRWFRAAANSFDDDAAPGVPSTTLANSHPSYLGNGSNNTNAFFANTLFPLSSGTTVAGSPGNIWTTVKIDVNNIDKTISFFFDNKLTFKGQFVGEFDGLVSLGLADTFASSVDPGTVYTVFDNLVVTIPEPSSIALVASLALAGLVVARRR